MPDKMQPDTAPRHHEGAATAYPEQPLALRAVPAALELLERRRSVPLRALRGPGPAPDELDRMLTIAARVPDHGALAPWRFIVLEGAARAAAGAALDALYARQNPQLPADKASMWGTYLSHAPVTVVLVSRPDAGAKIPVFNQLLSVGAAGMNLVLAAEAMGYAAQWLLKWPGRDPQAAALLGVGPQEAVAGFIHIGRPAIRREDRARPALDAVVTRWRP